MKKIRPDDGLNNTTMERPVCDYFTAVEREKNSIFYFDHSEKTLGPRTDSEAGETARKLHLRIAQTRKKDDFEVLVAFSRVTGVDVAKCYERHW